MIEVMKEVWKARHIHYRYFKKEKRPVFMFPLFLIGAYRHTIQQWKDQEKDDYWSY